MSVTINSKMSIAEIEAMLMALEAKQEKQRKGVDTLKYCGKVSFKKDGLALQKAWRDEW